MIESKNLKRESRILISYVKEKRIEQFVLSNKEWEKLLKLASANRILFHFVKELAKDDIVNNQPQLKKNINRILEEGKGRIEELEKTLEVANAILTQNKIFYMVVKTKKNCPYIALDLDVLVRPQDFVRSENLFKKAGARVELYALKDQRDILLPDLVRIDLHKDFCWQGPSYLDEDFIWNGYRQTEIGGVSCIIPSKTVEWTLTALNLFYEKYYIPLHDFLYLIEQTSEVNFEKIYSQAKKYGWDNAFTSFLSILVTLEKVVLNDENIRRSTRGFKIGKIKIALPVQFPYPFSVKLATTIFWERLVKRHYLRPFEVAYYIFSKSRFHLTGGMRVPVYGDWFDFGKLKW